MEPTAPPAEKQDPTRGSSERSGGGTTARLVPLATKYNTVLTFAAASVAPILYLVFIDRYATNSFYGDDWSVAPMIRSALSDRLSLIQLWAQYNESRLFVGNTIDVLFGFFDRYDLRSVMFLSAVLFIVSYAVLLALFRRYLGTRLTPIPVLVVGLTWFSLADVQNSLWAFQVSWYLTVLFFVMVLCALQVPDSRRGLWFAVAVVAAIAASLSTVQGFLCWPLGAICIAWAQPWTRRAFRETALWFGAMIVTVVLYFPGYDFSNNGCHPVSDCSPSIALHHPLTTLGFFFGLIGNVVPGGIYFGGVFHLVHNAARFEVVGVALFAAAVFILVQSWRHRTSTERFPLPLLLIGFALLFDVTVSLGRGLMGPFGAANSNRYVMANLILLMGIVMYALAHIPHRLRAAKAPWQRRAAWMALCVLALFLTVQVTEATEFGLTNGRAVSESLTTEARLVVNEDRVPKKDLPCALVTELFFLQPGWSPSRIEDAREGQLGELDPSSYRYYRELGPPAQFPECPK
jgi:hypothetical protein